MKLRILGRWTAATVLTALPLVLLSGCGESLSPTIPSHPQEAPELGQLGQAAGDGSWYEVGGGRVTPGRAATIGGSRYTLHFSKGSVAKATNVVIEERRSDIIDVRFSPDDVEFKGLVTLVIDYAGSMNEAVFRAPGLARLDADTGRWVAWPGHNDHATRTYVVALEGFSRYALLEESSALPGGRRGHPPRSIADSR